jgi:type III secretion protein V
MDQAPMLEQGADQGKLIAAVKPSQGLTVCIGSNLAITVPQTAFQFCAQEARAKLQYDLGVEAPDIALFPDQTLPANRFSFELDGVPVFEGEIPANSFLIDDETSHLEVINVPFQDGKRLGGYHSVVWVNASYEEVLWDAGIRYLPPVDVLGGCLSYILKRYAAQFVGIQEVHKMLATVEANFPDLVKETDKICSLQRVTEILRRLVDENVPIRNLRPVLEAIVEWGQRENDTLLLVEYVRTNLARVISHRYADENRVISAFMLERSLEDALRTGIQRTAVGPFLAISEDVTRPFIEQIQSLFTASPISTQPVVVTAMDLRRHVHNLLMRNNIELPVLSYQELAPEFAEQVLAVIQSGSYRRETAGEWELNSAADTL